MVMDESSTGYGIDAAARRRARTAVSRASSYAWGFLIGIVAAPLGGAFLSAASRGEIRQLFAAKEADVLVILLALLGIVPTCVFVLSTMAWSRGRGDWRLSARYCTLSAALLGAGYVLIAVPGLMVSAMFGASDLPLCAGGLLYVLGVPFVLGYPYALLIRRARVDGPACPECGYLLYYAAGQRCPDCGRTFIVSEIDMTCAVIGSDGVLRPREEHSEAEAR